MTVTLSDFTWAVRPTVSDVELTDGGDIVASSGWTAGVGGWAAWDTTTALEALTDEYTIVVVLDPNQASSAWRGLLSIPAYASGAHASPYHVMLLAASGLGDPTKLAYYQSIANVGAVYQSATGAIDTSTDGQTCYAVRRSGTNVDYLVDGVEVSSSTVAAGALDWTPHGPVCLGTRSASSPGEGCAGTYVFAGVADRALTDDELAAITASPLGFEGGDVTGTIAATLANLTSTITGTETITGTIAATLANLTSTITGYLAHAVPPALSALTPQWPGVDLLDADGVRIGEATAYDLDAVVRALAAGPWVMTTTVAGLALDDGASIADIAAVRVVDELGVAFTGTVRPIAGEDNGGVTVEGVGASAAVTFAGSDAGWAALASRRAYPDPSTEAPWATSHDTRTGRASTVVAEFIEANLGSSALPDREWPDLDVVDGLVGIESTWSARLQRLDRLVARICNDAGLVCRPTFALDGSLRVVIVARSDLSARQVLSDQADLSTLTDRSFAATASHVIAAGQGELELRAFEVASSPATGRDRAEHFIDRRNLADTAELATAASSTLAAAAASRVIRAELSAAAAAQMRYRFHYDVGDIVSVEIAGVRHSSSIESVRIQLNATEYRITPQFGEAAPDAWSALVRIIAEFDAVSDENTT